MKIEDVVGPYLVWFVVVSISVLLTIVLSLCIMPIQSEPGLWNELDGARDTRGMKDTIGEMVKGK